MKLTEEEHTELTALLTKGKGVARRITRAQILLLINENRSDGSWKDSDSHLVQVACSQALDGYDRWSLRLLMDKLVELMIV